MGAMNVRKSKQGNKTGRRKEWEADQQCQILLDLHF